MQTRANIPDSFLIYFTTFSLSYFFFSLPFNQVSTTLINNDESKFRNDQTYNRTINQEGDYFHFQNSLYLKVFEIIIKVLYQCLQTLLSVRLVLLRMDACNFQDFDALGKNVVFPASLVAFTSFKAADTIRYFDQY